MTSDLWTIGYVSSATREYAPEDLERLLAQARARNAADGITGLLLYAGGNFMQVIEGPREAVQATWTRICRSPRHHGIIQLFDEPVPAREFDGWSMAFREAGPRQLDGIAGAPSSTRRALLLDFWASMR